MEKRKAIEWTNYCYEVSDTWLVRSVDRINRRFCKKKEVFIKREYKGRLLKQHKTKWGYQRVQIRKKGYLVHRLVYCTFNDVSLLFEWQKTNTVVMHKNDIPHDNRLENLLIWSQIDNIKDMMKKGRRKKNTRKHIAQSIAGSAKINYKISCDIKEDYKKTKSIYKTADNFGVSYATVSRINNNKIRTRDYSLDL